MRVLLDLGEDQGLPSLIFANAMVVASSRLGRADFVKVLIVILLCIAAALALKSLSAVGFGVELGTCVRCSRSFSTWRSRYVVAFALIELRTSK